MGLFGQGVPGQESPGLVELLVFVCPLGLMLGLLVFLLWWLRGYARYKARTEEHMRLVEEKLDRIASLLEREPLAE